MPQLPADETYISVAVETSGPTPGDYDTQDMLKVMQILDSLSQGPRPPEFLSSHPDPGNRILQIQNDIQSIDQCP